VTSIVIAIVKYNPVAAKIPNLLRFFIITLLISIVYKFCFVVAKIISNRSIIVIFA
jgi:hypothetical protein